MTNVAPQSKHNERSMLRIEAVEEAAVIRLLDLLAQDTSWKGTMYIGELVDGRPSPRMCTPEFRNAAPLPDTWQEIGFSGTKGAESTWSLVLVAEGGPNQWTATWMGQMGAEREPEDFHYFVQLGPAHMRMVPSVRGMMSVHQTLRIWSVRTGTIQWVALGAARRLGWDLSVSTPPRKMAVEAAWNVAPAGREGDATAVAGPIAGWWPGTIIGHQTMSGMGSPPVKGEAKTLPSGPPRAVREAKRNVERRPELPVPAQPAPTNGRAMRYVGIAVLALGLVTMIATWIVAGRPW